MEENPEIRKVRKTKKKRRNRESLRVYSITHAGKLWKVIGEGCRRWHHGAKDIDGFDWSNV